MMYNANDIISILALLVVLLVVTFLIVFLLFTTVLSLRSTHIFFLAVYNSLGRENVEKLVCGIRNEYEVYRRRRFGAGWKDIISLCQELSSKLKSNKDKTLYGYVVTQKDIDNLEEAIEALKDENNFEDEKINKVIEEISKNVGNDSARKIKEYIIRIQAYCQGQIFEKENEKQNYKNKIERQKWLNRINAAIGIAGGIITIYNFFIG